MDSTAADAEHAGGPPREPTILEHALLGLAAFQPRSGYDLHKLFAQSPMGQFSSSPGAIYPALRRLEEWGCLDSDLEGGHAARPRRVYTITGLGREVLSTWLRQRATPREVQDELPAVLLRFTFAELALTRLESIGYLESLRGTVEDYIAELEHYRTDLAAGPLLHPALSVVHGIRSLEATLEWIEDTIERLEAAPEPPAIDTLDTGELP